MPQQIIRGLAAVPQMNDTTVEAGYIVVYQDVRGKSSWFPLYDRNPQTFVPNIMFARPENYVKATHRIWRAPGRTSQIDFPVMAAR